MIEAVGKGELDVARATPASVEYFNLLHRDAPVTLVRVPMRNSPSFVGRLRSECVSPTNALVDAVNEAIDRLFADGPR